jgi:hypothetical protein
MIEVCDKCKSKIINGKCECGEWYEKYNHPEEAYFFKNALDAFAELDQPIFSMDDTQGIAAVFFKGNYDDVVKVREFIRNLKKYD